MGSDMINAGAVRNGVWTAPEYGGQVLQNHI